MEEIEVLVGRVGKPHGIRGELTIDVRTDEPDRRFAPGASLRTAPARDAAEAPPERLTVARSRWHQQVLLVAFEGVEDRTAAERLRGTLLHATLAPDAVPEDPEEFYDHQLVGLAVVDTEGRELGELTGVRHNAAQDLLEVRTTDGRDVLVPFVTALVPSVDLDEGVLVVADRPGLVAPFPDE